MLSPSSLRIALAVPTWLDPYQRSSGPRLWRTIKYEEAYRWTVSEARNSISRDLGFYNAAGATLLVVAAKSRELGDALKVRKTKAGAPRRTLTPRSLGLIVQSGEDCAGC